MADITMCSGVIDKDGNKTCPKLFNCYRHMAFADPFMQSYFIEVPGKYKTDKEESFDCEYFWDKDKR